MDESKIQIGIYKIEDKTQEEMFEIISSKAYVFQDLQNEQVENFTLSLFYYLKDSTPKWKEFLNSIAQSGQEVLNQNQTYSESFVLLLKNTENENLYAVAGGLGYFAIQEHIGSDFGIDILSRLIKKDEKILRATKERSYVGGIVGTTKHFRTNSNLFETDSFGKIYQELNAKLNKEVLIEKLGFTDEDIKKDSVCIAKPSFKINKSISFEQLLRIIKGCEWILENETPISINNVEKLTKKKDQDLIETLDVELVNQLWDRFSEQPGAYSFDLCHKNFEEYLTASEYVIRKGFSKNNFLGDRIFEEFVNIDDLFAAIRESEYELNDIEDFQSLIASLIVYSFDEEGGQLTRDSLLAHILGDVTYENKKYFYIDKSWYRINDEFISELNSFCKAFINRNFHVGLEKEWDYPNESENQYCQKYIGESNTIVLDKITPENIELCDILKWDANSTYLYHVKADFGNTMRDLCSQLLIAANRVSHAIRSSREYLRKVYLDLQNKIGGENYFDLIGKQTERYSEEDFISLFDKELYFVLAVLDTATDRKREIQNIEEFKSNIAKFSLQELVKEMRGFDINFKITQLKKPM